MKKKILRDYYPIEIIIDEKSLNKVPSIIWYSIVNPWNITERICATSMQDLEGCIREEYKKHNHEQYEQKENS